MSIIASGTTSGTALVSTGNTNGNLVFQTNGTTTALTLATDQLATFAGKASFPSTIGVGGATAAASGSGVSFPATQSASSDVNTLDDYEEGTFTPAWAGSTVAGSGTYSSRSGTYVKIGKLVYVQITMQAFTGGTGSGDLIITGLPFSGNFGGVMFSVVEGLTFPSSQLSGYANGTQINLQSFVTNSTQTNVAYDSAISNFFCSAIYSV